jgi:hypothetical protein
VTVADLAIIAGLVFACGTFSARLECFDMTAPLCRKDPETFRSATSSG